jgi:hypothetical protein
VQAAGAVRGTHPGSFAVVMATGIVSAALRDVSRPHASAALLVIAAAASVIAAAALAAWLALAWLVPGRMTASHREPPAITDVSGNWYLWVVGTQSLAIAATFVSAGGQSGRSRPCWRLSRRGPPGWRCIC